ncbi:hypothetical protein AB6E05_23750 [Vibrio alginolyticus]|uniref:hypothetical protein n=1 Tax=Vibrio alginolyticus TaxID=663 RepID=UPI002B3AFE21|nr:hypothetical protein [Vibrio parahaemolyticus]HDM8236409.1 hypothetical protein [Vibrio campbellii]
MHIADFIGFLVVDEQYGVFAVGFIFNSYRIADSFWVCIAMLSLSKCGCPVF